MLIVVEQMWTYLKKTKSESELLEYTLFKRNAYKYEYNAF